MKYAFFGTGPLAESVLSTLYKNGYTPSLIVTKQDSPKGRHLTLTPPNIKIWGQMKGIEVFQPESLKNLESSPLHDNFDLFIVASYGKIIPKSILDIPIHGTINVHPSLLPSYRGPSPIQSALLDGITETAVSIMKLDEGMDTGPVYLHAPLHIHQEATSSTLEVEAGQLGGELLVQILPHILDKTITPSAQDDAKATICKKIDKSLGEITLETKAFDVRKKWKALTPWPGLYFFIDKDGKQIRIKVKSVDLTTSIKENTNADKVITEVTPEGKKDMSFEDFRNGYLG